MNKLFFFILICFLATNNFVAATDSDLQIHPYEVDDVCNRCNCTQKSMAPIFTLNCAEKDLKRIFDNYGDLFGTNEGDENDYDKIVDVTYSNNDIGHLNRLPATDAIIAFSCRNCQIMEIAADVFNATPNILAADLSYNHLNGEFALEANIFRGTEKEDGLFNGIGLLHLDLSNNQIESLNENTFQYIMKLKRLSLAGNPLKILDDKAVLAIGSLNDLVRLDLSYAELIDIPDELFNRTMPHLRDLNLDGNHLKSVPESLSLLGSSLWTLSLGRNPIEFVGDESFLGLTQLIRLYVNNMPNLDKIYSGTFASLLQLQILDFSNNSKLIEFDLGYLARSTYLREIYISNCSIKSLGIHLPNIAPYNDSEILPLNRLKYLKLNNNPWHCDCALYKTFEKIKRHNNDVFLHNGGARCETPYELVSDLLTDLTSDTSCKITNIKKPYRIPAYELPPFLRPRSIFVSLLSVLIVVIIGLSIGLVIVHVKRKLIDKDIGFTAPIRYQTVRNSTSSTQ